MHFFTLFFMFLFSSSLLAFENLSFSKTHISWSIENQGSISADSIVFDGKDYLVVPGEVYPLQKNASHQLIAKLPLDDLNVGINAGKNLKNVDIKNLNFELKEKNNLFFINSFIFTNLQSKINTVQNLKADCSAKSVKKSLLAIIFSSCFNNGEASLEKAIFPGVISAENIQLKVLDNKFQLDGNLVSPVQGSAKIKGISNYDMTNNKLIVEVQSAKIEIFNIRSRLFKEMAKIKSPNIKVEEPFIIVSLK